MATITNGAPRRKSDIGIDAINLLKSPLATLVVLCSALLAQLPHAADVFRLIVVGDGLWPTLHSYTYAVALELAVLLFVVQRRNVESYLFAFVSILVNLSYYYLHGVALLSIAALPAWLVSIALPAAIAQYSHLIAAATDEHATPPAKSAKPVKPRRYFWQFWRPRPVVAVAAVIAATNSGQGARQTDLESLGDENATATITESEIEPHSASPVGTAQTLNVGGKPAKPGKRTVNPNRDRALQMRSEGFTPSEIASLLNEKESTVASWLYRGAHKNGVAK
jgi:hypothetical protein